MDNVSELGKTLRNITNKTEEALQKQHPNYPSPEIARDIFDPNGPLVMHFTPIRANMSVKLDLMFEGPPPMDGMKNCCGDCFCANCEPYLSSDFTSRVGLTSYPYLDGTIRITDALVTYPTVTETDPEAGIFTLNYDPIEDTSNIIYICYVYRYDEICTGGTTFGVSQAQAQVT